MIKLGEKIKSLRKQKNISQEVFANYLGVSFQAVSKWENGNTMPDVTMIPAIASFFGVSTDELFDFNLYEMEKQVETICKESWKYRDNDPAKAEQILREGLKRFPGNDNILNNLLYTLDYKTRADEVITLCKTLIESTKYDDVKYDACRMLASCYKTNGQDDLVAPTLELIPEIYFSKLELEARLLDGEESYEAAHKHKSICVYDLLDMLIIIGKHLKEKGEKEQAASQLKIAQKIIDAFKEDYPERKWPKASVYEKEIEELFDFNLYETEKQVEAIVDEYSKYWDTDKHKCELILREGLKKYPGNDILLDCLTDVLCELGRNDEVIKIGKALVESTKHDDLRFDAYRSMAEAYKAKGEYALAKEAIEHIPEIYFSNLYVKAYLLEGEEKYEAAAKESSLCLEHLIWMLEILGEIYLEKGEAEKAKIKYTQAINVLKAFENDFETKYTHSQHDPQKVKELEHKLSLIP